MVLASRPRHLLHLSQAGDYWVEGHVPADIVKRLDH